MSDTRDGGIGRRALLRATTAAGALGLAGAATGARAQVPTRPPRTQVQGPLGLPPIVFVHGNGDTAALWITTLWRFETNGHPRGLLHALDMPYPVARTDDSRPQPGRSSAAEQREALAAAVARILAETRRRKVALVGSSRGGLTIRNYLKNGGGAEFVSHAVLCGAPNRGVIVSERDLVGSEFNGAAPFLRQLNEGPDDTVPGVPLMTLRSDRLDKFAQPDGQFIGLPGKPTGIGFDGPELRGAKNVELPGLDHREVAFHKLAFAQMHEFILGKPAGTLFIAPERQPVLNGRVTGFAEGVYTNLPVAGATVEIFAVDPRSGERRTQLAAHRKVTGGDGVWGPFRGDFETHYEFVVAVAGSPTTHIYRSPFLRSSDVVHLRPAQFGRGDADAGAVVVMTRPRGYFGHGRDQFLMDGRVPPGINEGVPGASTGRLAFDAEPRRTVVTVFNNEIVPVRTWPVRENRIAIAEFTN